MTKTRGFTLTELLVVIAIIGLLTSVALGSLQKARANARNAQRTATVQAYKLGFELAFDIYNQFPGTVTGTYTCLGKYVGGRCWNSAYANDPSLDAIINSFVPGSPTPDPTNLFYNGILYEPRGPTSYNLLWFMEGLDARNCSPGIQIYPGSYDSDNQIYCLYQR